MQTTQIHLTRTTLGIFLAYASSGWRKSASSSTRWTIVPGLSLSINLVIETLLHILNGQIPFRHIWTIISIIVLYSLFGQWKSVVSFNIFGWMDECSGRISIDYSHESILTHIYLNLIQFENWNVRSNVLVLPF